MNKSEATKLVAILRAAYPQAQIQPETPTAYHLALSDVSFAAAEQAVAVLLRTAKFLPTPAEIREVLAEAALDAKPWEDAWTELMSAVRRYGSYLMAGDGYQRYRADWPGWSSPEVAAAVETIGYVTVCMTEAEAIPTLRAQFRDAYRSQVARKKTELQTGEAALPRGEAGLKLLKPGRVA